MSEVNIWDLLKQLYGPAMVTQLQQVTQDPRLAGRILVDLGGMPAVDVDKVLATLSSYLKGGDVPDADLLQAVQTVVTTLRDRRKYLPLPPQQLPQGRRADGLLEAALRLIQVKADQPFKMTLVDIDPAALQADVQQAQTNRGIIEHSSGLYNLALNNNRVLEDRIYNVVSTEYGKVRKAALADSDFGGPLKPLEDYLFGPAQQGAQQAKDNRKKEEELQQKAEDKAYAKVDQDVRQDVAGQMQGLVDNLIQNLPPAEPPSQGTGAGAGNKGAGGTGAGGGGHGTVGIPRQPASGPGRRGTPR